MLQLTRLQLIAYPTKHLPVELPVITFTGLLFAETIPRTSKGSQSTEQTYRSQNDPFQRQSTSMLRIPEQTIERKQPAILRPYRPLSRGPYLLPFWHNEHPSLAMQKREVDCLFNLNVKWEVGIRNSLVNLNVRVTQHHIHVRRSAHRTDRAGRKDNCNVV